MNPDNYYYLEDKVASVTIPKLRLLKDDEVSMLLWDLKANADAGTRAFTDVTFETSGLALEFSRLKNKKDKDIAEFANKYGPLGVGGEGNIASLNYDYHYLYNFKFQDTPASKIRKLKELGLWFESIDEWHWHIRHVDKLLKMFVALQNGKPIEEKHLKIMKTKNFSPPIPIRSDEETMSELRRVRELALAAINNPLPKEEQKPAFTPPESHVYWAKDNAPTLWHYEPPKSEISVEEEYRRYAWKVLESHIIEVLEKGSFTDYRAPRVDNKAAFGFSLSVKRATKYLLVAIYQDLYRTVNNNEAISLCAECKGPFKGKKKGSFLCGNACKQVRKRAKDDPIEGGVEVG